MRIIEKGLVGLAPRRKAAGYTQYSYADALGIDRALVAMYETGRAWPSASRLPAMAELLGCSIDELYELPEAAGGASPSPTETIISRAEA